MSYGFKIYTGNDVDGYVTVDETTNATGCVIEVLTFAGQTSYTHPGGLVSDIFGFSLLDNGAIPAVEPWKTAFCFPPLIDVQKPGALDLTFTAHSGATGFPVVILGV